MTTLSPEQISFIVEWWRSGNEWRTFNRYDGWPTDPLVTEECRGHGALSSVEGERGYHRCRLNPAGITIAKMAIALEQACATAEESQAWVGSPGLDDEIETMRVNKKELLG